mgnify:CR=1 FL=1
MAVFYDKSKFVRCFLRPNSTHIQICSVKHCLNIFQGTKISLEILIASAVCQLGNIFDFAATHKFIFKIQNLWQEHKFKFVQRVLNRLIFSLKHSVFGTSVSNTNTTVVPA